MGLRTLHRFTQKAAVEYENSDARKHKEAYRYLSNHPHAGGAFLHPLHNKTVVTGRQRENTLLAALDKFGFERSDLQIEFHKSMFLSCIGHIYKHDLPSETVNIKHRHKVKNLDKIGTAILAARRIGKTYSIASFIAAYMIAVEESTQLVFSTGQRASKLVLDLVYKFLLNYNNGEFKDCIIRKNQEDLWVRGPLGPNDIRKLKCVPSSVEISVDGLRNCFSSKTYTDIYKQTQQKNIRV